MKTKKMTFYTIKYKFTKQACIGIMKKEIRVWFIL